MIRKDNSFDSWLTELYVRDRGLCYDAKLWSLVNVRIIMVDFPVTNKQ